tara:strand:- start:1527 stop:1808 length:282 start_codon:yes stop_codon:yes gene_type:complete
MSDLKPDVNALLETLKASVTDPEKQDILEIVASKSAELAMLALTDPEKAEASMDDVKAIMASLGQAEAAAVVQATTDWVAGIASRVMSKVLPV